MKARNRSASQSENESKRKATCKCKPTAKGTRLMQPQLRNKAQKASQGKQAKWQQSQLT
jgi:hypothetical protein